MGWLFLIILIASGVTKISNDNRNYSTSTINNNYHTSKIEIPKGFLGVLPASSSSSKGAEVKAKCEEVKAEKAAAESAAVNSAISTLDAK